MLTFALAAATPAPSELPTGQTITPLAAPGATISRLGTGLRGDTNADASGAVTSAVSPDGATLLVMTSGYNYLYRTASGKTIRFPVRDPLTGGVSRVTTEAVQWIFIYDIRGGQPVRRQFISLPNTFNGLAWSPSGERFYVSGGIDDRVLVYRESNGTFAFDAPAVVLGHNSRSTAPLPAYDGGIIMKTKAGRRGGTSLSLAFSAVAAGVSVSDDGRTLAVANMQNDSVTFADTRTRKVRAEVQLYRPGSSQAHGEYPYGVAIVSGTSQRPQTIFASCLRDGDVAVIEGTKALSFIHVGGEPNAMTLSRDRSTLYVANGDLDEVEVIDTQRHSLMRRIDLRRPGYRYFGASPNGLGLDEGAARLYVTLGGENAIAVIDLSTATVIGRIPAGWYPTSVSLRGGRLFITNAKSLSGPNPALAGDVAIVRSRRSAPDHADQYVLTIQKAELLALPIPPDGQLAGLSEDVDRNNGFGNDRNDQTLALLRTKVKHVIFIEKENRTYDQVLGDLRPGDGDPGIVSFPYPIAPNHHELASRFVTLDRFFTSGDVSADGWNWSVQARANEYTMRTTPIAYATNGFSYDWNGTNRNLNTGLPDRTGTTPFDARATTLLDPSGGSTILPGTKDIAATQGDGDEAAEATGGFLWDAALRAHRSVRHYGLYVDETYYKIGAPFYIPIVRDAAAKRAPQAPAVRPALLGRTDPYFRGWDLNVPDRYRFEEWKREFDGYAARGDLPALEVVCLMMDHFGNFSTNVGGLNTPYLQMADNDYALGKLVETVSHSVFWKSTAIVVLEDDSQDGPDHVSPHRSVAYVISPYTKRRAVVHEKYTTVSMLRTVEDLLGTDHLGMFDANTAPMSAVFMQTPDLHPYDAVLPGSLCVRPVHRDLIPECSSKIKRTAVRLPKRDAAWWARETRAMDFDHHDAVDPNAFNELLKAGL